MVNEAGELGIDGMLVREVEGGLVEIVDGCVCCTVLGDLSQALADLLQASTQPLDRVLIETSGLASPGPVVRTLGASAGVGLCDPSSRPGFVAPGAPFFRVSLLK